jgi:hypothetical protein
MGIVSQKLRDSARGQDCTFRIAGVCNRDPATTVFCHAPHESKGMGNKSHDFIGAFGCSACHDFMDRRSGDSTEDRTFFWLVALKRTWVWWVENGYITFPASEQKWKPLTKTVPRPEHFRR